MQTVGVKIAVDGGAQFKNDLDALKTKSKELASQLQAVTTGSDNYFKKVKTLNSEIKNQESYINKLNEKLTSQKKNLEEMNKALEKAKKDYGETSPEAQKLTSEVQKQETQISKTSAEINKATSELNGFKSKLKEIKSTENPFAKFAEGANKLGSKLESIGSKLTTSLTVPLVGLGTVGVKAASDLEENMNKVETAFGDSAGSVKRFAQAATESFGLSEAAALEAASLFGDMGTSMGLTEAEAAKMSTSLTGLAGDLSSFKNIDIEQAMTALKGVFTGETESLKGLGVVMTQMNLEQFAKDQGKVWKEMSETEKVTLRYQYVLSKTKNAQGDYRKTSKGTANSLRTLKAQLQNMAATLGKELLPIITPLIGKVTKGIKDLMGKFKKLSPQTKDMILKAVGIAAALGPVLTIAGKVTKAVGLLSKGISLLTNPVGLVVVALAALVAAGIAVYKNWDTIKAKATEIWGSIKTFLSNTWNSIKTTSSNIWTSIKTTVVNTWSNLKSLAVSVWDTIKAAITNRVTQLKTSLTNLWTSIKTTASSVWDTIKSAIVNRVTALKTSVNNIWTSIKTTATSVWNGIKSVASSVWSGIKTAITNPISTAKSLISTAISGIKSLLSFTGLSTTVTNVFKKVKTAIETPINNAKAAVQNAINAIKSFFSFNVSIPVPKLSISPAGWQLKDLLRGVVPSISLSWGTYTASATPAYTPPATSGGGGGGGGGGSKPPTVNIPMTKGYTGVSGSGSTIVMNVYGAEGQSVDQLANVVMNKLQAAVERNRAVYA